ncbi:MAG: bifunctional DNA-formamidopyrimidine glycosylase/DNA-(apurinic or apyrimidinic site) lyase [Thermomicrobiales bacterium]
MRMPELPEVETVRRSLLPHVVGRQIVGLRLTDIPGVLGGADPVIVAAMVTNRTIVGLRRRAKYLMFDLDDATSLVVHLGMTGTLTLPHRSAAPLRFERLAVELDDGSDLRFADQRKFGRVIHASPDRMAQIESRIGPEPLDSNFTSADLAQKLQRRTGRLKSVLLDQKLVGGLGNIYVDEALFRARLHPLRNPSALSAVEVRRLHRAIRVVLREAIANRGTTFSSYRDGTGQEGGNQAFLQVYGRGRQGSPCLRCGLPLDCLVISGRSSHYCPNCQPLM